MDQETPTEKTDEQPQEPITPSEPVAEVESGATESAASEQLDVPQVFQTKSHPPFVDYRIFDEQINRRIEQWRAKSWEDDISVHTLDSAPFVNLCPPGELDTEAFNPGMLIKVGELIGDEDINNYIKRDTFPIPSADDREGYSPSHHGNYWLSGFQDFYKIQQTARELGTNVQSFLDFGCASGRVIRHFCAQTEIPEIWGSDINARHIRWLSEHMPPTVRPIANHCIPTLPIADDSIDVISAFSVFTHIDTFESCWLAELSRILRPGGFAYLTVHNEDTWDVIREEVDNPNNRLVQSLKKIDPDTAEKLKKPMPKTRLIYRFTDFGPYRAQVFHSNDFLHQNWGRFFNIHAILPCHHVRQSVVVLTKK